MSSCIHRVTLTLRLLTIEVPLTHKNAVHHLELLNVVKIIGWISSMEISIHRNFVTPNVLGADRYLCQWYDCKDVCALVKYKGVCVCVLLNTRVCVRC